MYEHWKLLYSIIPSSVFDEIKDYVIKKKVKNLNLNEFIYQYEPDIIKRWDVEYIPFLYDCFHFLNSQQRATGKFYHYPLKENGKCDAGKILKDMQEWKEEPQIIEKYYDWKYTPNIFYGEDHGYEGRPFYPVKAKQPHVLLRPLYKGEEKDDISYKIIYTTAAIMSKNADIEYNKELLSDYEIIMDKWLQKGEMSDYRTVFLAYVNYIYTGKNLEWFLKVSLLNFYQMIRKEVDWNNIRLYSKEKLLNEYKNAIIKYYNETKEKHIEKQIEQLSVGREDMFFKYPPEMSLIKVPVFIGVLNLQAYGGDNFYLFKNMPEHPAYKNNHIYADWLLNFYMLFPRYNHLDRFCHDSFKSFLEFTQVGQENPFCRAAFGVKCQYWFPIFDLLPDDFDFSNIEETMKLFNLDSNIKGLHQYLLYSKTVLSTAVSTLKMMGEIQKEDKDLNDIINSINIEEITDFCFSEKTTKIDEDNAKQIRLNQIQQKSQMMEFYSTWLQPLLDVCLTPQNYKKYLEARQKFIKNDDTLTQIYEDILNNETERILEKVKTWEEYSSKDVQEKLGTYIDNMEEKIKKLYGNNYEGVEQIKKIAVDFISTGETMFKSLSELSDYGSVAINYYKALEWLINQIIYFPYVKNILIPLNNKLGKVTKEDLDGYAGDSYKHLVIFSKNNTKIKTSLELGTFSNFYSLNKNHNEKIIDFYEKRGVNIDKLKELANNLSEIRNLRNNCAHPQITTKASAMRGKVVVYDKSVEEEAQGEQQAKKIKEIIFHLHEIFK